MNKLIYLDNGATTKPDKEAIINSSIFNEECFFNASAKYHGGVANSKELNNIRNTFSKLYFDNFDVIFTSCGSESDNTAIFSYAKRGNIVTTYGEHSAVYEPFMELKNKGFDVRFTKLKSDGSCDIEHLKTLIDESTTFVSIVHVNNETGAINNVNEIAKIVKSINSKVIFHSDGVQAFMKIPFILSSEVDLYSVSAHKINGIKGVGALFKNKKLKNLKPLILGGGQENGLRSGTENLFGIKVFEQTLIKHNKNLINNYNYVKTLKQAFLNNIDLSFFKIISSDLSSPYIISLSGVGLKGEVLQHKLEEFNVIVGTGSACSSKHPHSRVLTQIGYSKDVLDGVIRVSFSYETEIDDVNYCAKKLNEIASELKRIMKK